MHIYTELQRGTAIQIRVPLLDRHFVFVVCRLAASRRIGLAHLLRSPPAAARRINSFWLLVSTVLSGTSIFSPGFLVGLPAGVAICLFSGEQNVNKIHCQVTLPRSKTFPLGTKRGFSARNPASQVSFSPSRSAAALGRLGAAPFLLLRRRLSWRMVPPCQAHAFPKLSLRPKRRSLAGLQGELAGVAFAKGRGESPLSWPVGLAARICLLLPLSCRSSLALPRGMRKAKSVRKQ
jgi:hypothetical protein